MHDLRRLKTPVRVPVAPSNLNAVKGGENPNERLCVVVIDPFVAECVEVKASLAVAGEERVSW